MSYTSTGKKKWGDKRDARLVRGLDGLHAYMPHMMPKRTDSECYLHKEIDVTKLLEYIKAHNDASTDENGELDPQKKLTVFHAIVYMTAKIIKERPILNMYINGRRFYQRDKISLSFVARKRFVDHSEEALMVLFPEENYTLSDFTSKIVGEVHQARKEGEDYGADSTLNILAKLPRCVMMFVQWILKTMDWYAVLPKPLAEMDPGHTTVLLSNLGSVGCDAVYHHLNNFGTNGIVITIGKIHKEVKIDENGDTDVRDMMALGITIDERLGDGFYFARSMKLFEYFAENPKKMELPLDEPLDFKY